MARTFAYKGWSVAFSYLHSEAEAQALQEELTQRGVGALAIKADVSDPEQAASFVHTAARQLREPDALVCCAGIALPQDVITHVSDEDWHRVFAINVDGLFYTVRAALPYFIQHKSGCLLYTSRCV